MQSLNLFKCGKNKLLYKKDDLIKMTRSKSKINTALNCLKIASKCGYARPAYDYRNLIKPELETNNIFKFINNFMYGSCHEIAFLMKYLLKINNFSSRIIRIKSKVCGYHWVIEFRHKTKWILVDPTLGLIFRHKIKKSFLSLKDLKKLALAEGLVDYLNEKKVIVFGPDRKLLQPNKKISLKKFANLEKDNYFFYKKKRSFFSAEKKYLSYFAFSEIISINDGQHAFKKKIINLHKINDYMKFEYPKYKEKKFKIFPSAQSYGIQNGKLVQSNKFLKFKNFIFKKEVNSNKVKIKNFPFPIINIKLDTKENKTLLFIRRDKEKSKKIYFKKKWIFEKKDNYNNFYSKPIRNIEIFNKDKIKAYQILFLSCKFI